MTPAEFNVLADSRLQQYNRTVDVADTLNALNCQVALGSPETRLSDFRLYAPEEIIEQTTDAAVNVFKQWVTVTGGETI